MATAISHLGDQGGRIRRARGDAGHVRADRTRPRRERPDETAERVAILEAQMEAVLAVMRERFGIEIEEPGEGDPPI